MLAIVHHSYPRVRPNPDYEPGIDYNYHYRVIAERLTVYTTIILGCIGFWYGIIKLGILLYHLL